MSFSTIARSGVPTVAIWDACRSRSRLAEQVLVDSGAERSTIRTLTDVAEIAPAPFPGVALVAIDGEGDADGLDLEALRTFKKCGYRVIAYGGGVDGWPLGVRCRILIEGAIGVLDSAAADFAAQLRRLTSRTLATGAARSDEDRYCREVMARLGIVGQSRAILSVFRRVVRISTLSGFSVLITGETGTGKELIAKAIHAMDAKRRKSPMVALNCAALSPTLVESELFGHRRGAFTGAERDRRGAFRNADGGILFLDEIGELELGLQAKLLRVLDEKRVLGLGEDADTAVDVRVIAATNRSLEQMMRQNEFRADLFHRLSAVTVHIPPLRERPEDILALAQHFCSQHSMTETGAPAEVDPAFVQALQGLDLSGNAREVENLIRQALMEKGDDAPLGLADLPPAVLQQICERIPKQPADDQSVPASPDSANGPSNMLAFIASLLRRNGWKLEGVLAQCEKLALQAALHATSGNRTETARLLGLTPRSIYNKERKHRLAV
jgi:transcriptional regulator with GAF, ATPase, and Fis domain